MEDVDKSAAFYANVLDLEETPHLDKAPESRLLVINVPNKIRLIQKEFAPSKKQVFAPSIDYPKFGWIYSTFKEKHEVIDDWTAAKKNNFKHRPMRWGGLNLHAGSGWLLHWNQCLTKVKFQIPKKAFLNLDSCQSVFSASFGLG